MKSFLFCFLALVFFSCSREKHRTLRGVWSSTSESVYQKAGVTDQLYFYGKDSFLLKTYIAGELKGTRRGSYVLNAKDKLLTVKFGNIENTSTILELTDTTLVSTPLNAKTLTKLKRLR